MTTHYRDGPQTLIILLIILLSPLPLTIRGSPSVEKATEYTVPVWPVSVASKPYVVPVPYFDCVVKAPTHNARGSIGRERYGTHAICMACECGE